MPGGVGDVLVEPGRDFFPILGTLVDEAVGDANMLLQQLHEVADGRYRMWCGRLSAADTATRGIGRNFGQFDHVADEALQVAYSRA